MKGVKKTVEKNIQQDQVTSHNALGDLSQVCIGTLPIHDYNLGYSLQHSKNCINV